MNERMEKALENIAAGGSLLLGGTLLGKAFGLFSRAAIAKLFGPSGLGLLALSLMVLSIGGRISRGGLISALKKFVPKWTEKQNESKVRSTILTTLTISMTVSIGFSIAVFYLSPTISSELFHSPDLVPLLRVMAIMVPIQTLVEMLAGAFLSFKSTKFNVLLKKILQPLGRLGMVIVIFLIGGSLLQLTLSYLAVALVLAVIGFLIMERKIFPIFSSQKEENDSFFGKFDFNFREILEFSIPLFLTGMLMLVMGWADTFMLGVFKTEEMVGIYNLVLPISKLLTIFLISLNGIFYPVISSLHAEKKIKELSDTFSTILRWNFFLVVPFFVFLVVFSTPLLSTFFPEYLAGRNALIILSVGMLFRAGLGPVGHTLETFEKTKFIFKVNAPLVGLNIVLNFFLIPIWGLEGAAIATALAFSLNNIIEMAKVRELISPSVSLKSYGKYTISAVMPALVCFGLWLIMPSLWWVLILLFTLYLALCLMSMLFIRSFEEEDLTLFMVIDKSLEKVGLGRIKITKLVERFVGE